MKRTRPLILLIGLGLCLGGGLVLLDYDQTGHRSPTHVVGSLGPESLDRTQVQQTTIWPNNWVSIAGGPDDPAVIHLRQQTPTSQLLDFKLPGFYKDSVPIAGRKCSRIDVPGLIKIQEVGLPELPVLSTTIMVPEGGKTSVKIVEHVFREIKMDPVEPSIGHLSRNIDPATIIPQFDPFYKDGGVFPEEPVILSRPFGIRELVGINVRFNPLRYDSGKGALIVTEVLVVDVITEGGHQKRLTYASGDHLSGAGFGRVYERLLDNYTAPTAAMDKYQRLQSQGRMLIISHDAFVPSLHKFMTWKRQRGIDVSLVTVGEIGATASAISQTIKTMYEEPGGLTWVILVGDKTQVPTMVGLYDGSDSDSRYTMVTAGDIYPDLFISRISAGNATEVQTQVNRFVAYEKNPHTGSDAGWYSKSAGIASDEGNPADFKRADYLRNDLVDFGFQQVYQIYQGLGGSTTMINEALEKGCSMINYLGHGTGYGWTSVPFSSGDVHGLDVAGQYPWIIDVSCSNGDFDLPECFAEAWMRAGTPENPSGAVAMIASSSLSPWVPPSVMQAEAIDLLVADEVITIGSLYYSGLMKVLDQYAGLDVAMQVMEQNVIFGDCSLMVRTRAPQEFSVDAIPELAPEATSWALDVSGPEGSVVALTSAETLHGSGVVNAVGQVVVDLAVPAGDRSALSLTVTGYNMVPFQSTVTVTNDGGGEISQEPDSQLPLPTSVTLMGNYPNPFNPSTHIVFDLPRDMQIQLAIYDIRGNLVRMLASETRTAGRQEVLWDGRNSAGQTAASGVYLYQLVTPEQKLSGRMLLTK